MSADTQAATPAEPRGAVDAAAAPFAAVHFAELPAATTVNRALAQAFDREKGAPDLEHSHHFGGRFENLYIPAARLPEIAPVIEFVVAAAGRLLGRPALRYGFWFNAMAPGQRTTLHSHEENDELLSAVYYVLAPAGSGRLVLHDRDARIFLTPSAGRLVMFAPDLAHEVERNDSATTRLSIAFNFGPACSAT
jgi:hypothetical protein